MRLRHRPSRNASRMRRARQWRAHWAKQAQERDIPVARRLGGASDPRIRGNSQKENFVGVVATDEWAAIQAAKAIQVTWSNGPALVSDSFQTEVQAALTNSANIYASSTQEVVGNADAAYSAAPIQRTRTYYSPYYMHGSVGPSCAVANVTSAPDANGIQATVWSGTQGVYPLQQALAQILGLPQSAIRVIYTEGAGCYGHNGADDAAADMHGSRSAPRSRTR